MIESEPGGGTAVSARVPAIGAGAVVGVALVSPVRMLIVDDHPVVRDGLRGMLAGEPDLEVVGEAADGEEALAIVGGCDPTSSSWTCGCRAWAARRRSGRSRSAGYPRGSSS